jgi:dimethylglycine dehydrogenase
MRDRARVVVIGGGVVGASILYHLTRAGWTDVVLVERKELTAGSTWHAAGGMHTLNGDPNVAALQKYTVELYREIEEISGQDCGIHLTGGILLADTDERMDWLRMAHARGRYLGMETELLSVAEARELVPFMEESYFVGAMYDPLEGHVDPSGVTHAYARAARLAGAEVNRNTWAKAIVRRSDGTWDIDCGDVGTINCEHFVNAGGLWAREVGRMRGLELPVLAMEHMYILTEDIPALAEWNASSGREGLHAIDFGGEIYMRQEGGGLLLGTYEPNGVPWSVDETPWDFGNQLLPPDLDRIADNLAVAFEHFPVFNEVGIARVVNGPFTFTPDGNPLVGPVRGEPGHWVAAGVMAGLSQGGGVGLALANWITEGDPGFDVWGMDVARYGDWATPRYTRKKVKENYGRRFRIAYPNEELPAGRPLITSPLYGRHDAVNAVWGASYGMEVPLWFQSDGKSREETVTFRRSNAWERVAEECRTVREAVGIYETTGFSKFEVTGPGARDWLDGMMANAIPRRGRLALTPMLNARGKVIGDLTVGALPGAGTGSTGLTGDHVESGDSERFVIFGSGIAERYYERWFTARLPADGSVRYRTLGQDLGGLSIAGPRAREVLSILVDGDVSGEAFRFLDLRETYLDMIPALIGRISFTGDLGYEIWVPAPYLALLHDLLTDVGRDHDMRCFGARALDSLRLEKNFGAWATEYRPIYDPYEAGMGWMVKPGKGDFVGKEAAAEVETAGPARRLVFFTVDAEDADCIGDEPIWHGSEVVGWITSGGYAHQSEVSMAMGYVPSELAEETSGFEIEVVGSRRGAIRLDAPVFDPEGTRMRS